MWGKDNLEAYGQTSHRRDENIYEYLFVFQTLLSLNSLNTLFLFAVTWHYSLGCFICGNTSETPVSMPYVTTAKVCVHKTITSYLSFIVHCSFRA